MLSRPASSTSAITNPRVIAEELIQLPRKDPTTNLITPFLDQRFLGKVVQYLLPFLEGNFVYRAGCEWKVAFDTVAVFLNDRTGTWQHDPAREDIKQAKRYR